MSFKGEMPLVPRYKGVSANVDLYLISNISPTTRKSSRPTTLLKKARGTT